ncbi:hypothetical protein BDB01DRAFT_478739 [Pilobolus umbonatus]|nr:hypothetical protein BDB01DRAFT_478739 [Pilobolus umbonatus]
MEMFFFIDVKWNNNLILFSDSKKRKTVIEDISNAIDNCCFEFESDGIYKMKNMNITDKFIEMVKFQKKTVSLTMKKPAIKGKTKATKKSVSPKNMTVNDLSIKTQMSIIQKHFSSLLLLTNQKKNSIPRDKYQEIISLYFDSLQIYIKQHLISKGFLGKSEKLEIYATVDSEVQDALGSDYESMRTIFLTKMYEPYPAQPIKLLHAEQITGAYCKDILKCYEHAEDYFDYPKYLVQVHLYPGYIDLALNAILPLDTNVKSTKDETALTLKKKRIQFNIVDVFANILWSHIQSIEECPVKCCSKHQLSNYEEDIEMYHVFIKQFKLYITKQFTINNKERTTDWHNPIDIPISSKCTCTYSITHADLLEVCITPAIDQLTSTIYASTIEKSISGNHKISHLVIMGTPFKLKCVDFTNQLLNLLKTTMDNTKQYPNPIPTLWIEDSIPDVIDQGMMSIINNPSGGQLEQITSGIYHVSLIIFSSTLDFPNWYRITEIEVILHSDIPERVTLSMRDKGIIHNLTLQEKYNNYCKLLLYNLSSEIY